MQILAAIIYPTLCTSMLVGHIRLSTQAGAVRPARMTGPPPVAQQVDVELELSDPRGERSIISSWSSSNGAPSAGTGPQPRPTRETCVSTGTSRRPRAKSSTQAAVLRPTPGSRQVRQPLPHARPRAAIVELPLALSQPRPIARRIAWIRIDLTCREAARAGSPPRPPRSGASLTASQPSEAPAQPQEGDVAVAVVGGLPEDGQDQLVERPLVRRRARDRRRGRAAGRGSPDAPRRRSPLALRDRDERLAGGVGLLRHRQSSRSAPALGSPARGGLEYGVAAAPAACGGRVPAA